jgi:hypothetical protein
VSRKQQNYFQRLLKFRQAIGANNFDGTDAKFKLGPLVLNLLACLFVAVACIVYADGTMALRQEEMDKQTPPSTNELSLGVGGILYSVACVLFFFAGLAAFSVSMCGPPSMLW